MFMIKHLDAKKRCYRWKFMLKSFFFLFEMIWEWKSTAGITWEILYSWKVSHLFKVQPWLQWLREADEESDDEKENQEEGVGAGFEEKADADSVGGEKAEVLVVENIAQLEVN